MNSREFRALARQRLAGKWGVSVLVSFVATLLGGTSTGSVGASSRINFSDSSLSDMFVTRLESILENLVIVASLFGILAVAGIIGLAAFIIGGAVELGHARYYIGVTGGETPEFSVLFSRFSVFLKAFGLRLYMALFIFLWGLLFLIPGIIAAYRYAMAPYLMAQYPEKGIRECVEDSKALMAGHKWRLFKLDLSFIGWAFLCVFTLGLGSLWLTPYTNAAKAAFYLERTGQLTDKQGGGWNPQPQA